MSGLRRYSRQMLVAGIGEDGQRRLGESTAAVAGAGLAHEIAVAYAARGGVGTIVPGEVDTSQLAPPFLAHPSARAVVAGSRAALTAMRAALLHGSTT